MSKIITFTIILIISSPSVFSSDSKKKNDKDLDMKTRIANLKKYIEEDKKKQERRNGVTESPEQLEAKRRLRERAAKNVTDIQELAEEKKQIQIENQIQAERAKKAREKKYQEEKAEFLKRFKKNKPPSKKK